MSALTIPEIEARVLDTQRRPGTVHTVLILLAACLAVVGGLCWSHMIRNGMQVTGLNRPVCWGFLITDFVFWVGIAHSGTLISAILLLFRAHFRTAVYRVAEAMTVFGVMTAGLYPIVHLGRPWFFYWLFPYPNERHLWINFRSPLLWDVFAVSTYFIVSTIFLVVGMIPDVAALRNASQRPWRKSLYRIFSFGWRGTDEEWRHYTRAYIYFATFATPLVVSVHSVVSWDFAVSSLPGWHSTLFPPYFVAGAIFSGIAMVVTILIPLRRGLHLEDIITVRHLEMLARIVLLMSLIITYSYVIEFVLALRWGPADERSTLLYRASGTYAPLFWVMIACNSVLPLALFFRKVRTSIGALLAICLLINVGMWLERLVIIVTSLAHDRLPFDWRTYTPTWIEAGMTVGAFGWFFFWLLIFIRLFPAVSIAEMKEASVHDAV